MVFAGGGGFAGSRASSFAPAIAAGVRGISASTCAGFGGLSAHAPDATTQSAPANNPFSNVRSFMRSSDMTVETARDGTELQRISRS
jgi:hypothetical protein